MSVYILVIFLNLVSAIFIRSNKLLTTVSFLYLGFLSGQTDLVNNRDTFNYFTDFNMLGNFGYKSRFEWAYVLIEKFAKHVGLSYKSFRLIGMIIAYMLLAYCVSRIISNTSVFYVLYSVFAFPLEATQVRTFFMFVTFMGALCLILSDRLPLRVIAVIVSLVAPGFHSIGYFFAALIVSLFFLRNKNLRSYIYFIPIVSGIVTLILVMPGVSTIVVSAMVKVLSYLPVSGDIVMNVSTRFSNNGSLLTTLAFGIVYLSLNYLSVFDSDKVIAVKPKFQINTLQFSAAFISMAIPLLMISGQYQRILRYGVLIICISWILKFEASDEVVKVKDLVYGFLGIGGLCVAIVLFYGLYSSDTFANTIPYLLQFN